MAKSLYGEFVGSNPTIFFRKKLLTAIQKISLTQKPKKQLEINCEVNMRFAVENDAIITRIFYIGEIPENLCARFSGYSLHWFPGVIVFMNDTEHDEAIIQNFIEELKNAGFHEQK